MILGHDLFFWFATFGAGILKLVLSPWNGIVKGATSFASALFLAIVFTDPVLAWLNLSPDDYKAAAAALIAITGEGVTRWALSLISDPAKLLEWVKAWRGSGK